MIRKIKFILYKRWINSKEHREWLAVLKEPHRYPTVIASKDKAYIMSKEGEKLRPVTKLRIGGRYITTMSKLAAKKLAMKFIKLNWNTNKSMRKVYLNSKKVALMELYKNYYGNGKEPRVRIWKGKTT